jgi:MFS family permease
LGLVFLTAFLDLAGFSILFPLFPALLDHYVAREGPGSLIGQLHAQLAELAGAGGDDTFLVHALFGGLLGSLYSILQFVFAPIWGVVSDRRGRRTTVLFTLLGTALAHLLWIFAGSFAVLIIARLAAGLMAGNIATVSAVVADTTTPRDRAKGMGVLGAAIGLGFVCGPAIGGLASLVDLREFWPQASDPTAALALNPFSVPALAAFVLAAINFGWAWARFPETLPPERRGRGESERSANLMTLFTGLSDPGVRRTNLVYFAFGVAFSAAEFTLVFLAVERFGYTPRENAWMFVYVGLLIALVQGGLVRRLGPRLGELRLVRGGLVLVAVSLAVLAFAGTQPLLYLALGLMAVGSAFVIPCLSSLVSRYAPTDRQGQALGTFRSLGAHARAVGPALGGVLYWQLTSRGPYLVGAVLLLLPLFLVLGLARPTDDDGDDGEDGVRQGAPAPG